MVPASRPSSPATDHVTSSTRALLPVAWTRARSDVTRWYADASPWNSVASPITSRQPSFSASASSASSTLSRVMAANP